MARQITVPELGENIESAVVTEVLVSTGDTVSVDQPLVAVEAGKATLEIPADAAGSVEQVLVSAGDSVTVGQAIVELAEGDGGDTARPESAKEPDAGGKTDAAASASAGGKAEKPAAEKPVPEVKGADKVILPGEEPPAEAAGKPVPAGRVPRAVRHVPAAPSVRRFAREIGVDVDTVKGSGPHGRVSLDDVKRHARARNQAAQGAPMGVVPLPDFEKWGSVRRETMSSIRLATARHISLCWSIPRVTHFDQADITQLEGLRKRYADRAATQGGKLTMAVMVTKVVASALRKFPHFNAAIDMSRNEIVFREYVNVGIAVATERGLMVPVLRDADRKNMVQLAVEIDAVARRCREGKITPGDLEGGTFTVTNLGSIGGTHFTPIINFPEVAILGLGRASLTPVVRDGTIETGLILPLSLSYDHRLIDGADAARFVRWIAEAIEEPLILSLEGE